jgi:hypothetical protein
MGNMSYCRFQNTLDDLYDCNRHLEDELDKKDDADEYEARKELIKLCKEIGESEVD